MKVLAGLERSQKVTMAFRKMGHEAYSCDIEPCYGGHPEWHIQCDVLDILNDGWDLGIFHPVCRRLANSGVRWLRNAPPRKTLDELWIEFVDAVVFYKKLRDAPILRKAIENPVMNPYAIKLLGKPKRQVVQPWYFGDKAFKATGFELHNLPPLEDTNRLIPPKPGTEEHKKWSFIHRCPPGPDRERIRSETFPGMAAAMALFWGKKPRNLPYGITGI